MISISNLSPKPIEKICCHLQDRDLQALGTTSKRMHQIAMQQLEARDETLVKLLSSYTASRYFNIKSVKEANLLLIGEQHYDPQCKLNEDAIIEFLTLRFPVVYFIEQPPAMQVFHSLCKPNLHVVGWDEEETHQLARSIWQRYGEEKEHLLGFKEENVIVDAPEYEKRKNQLAQLVQEKEELIKEVEMLKQSMENINKGTIKNLEFKIMDVVFKIAALKLEVTYPKLIGQSLEKIVDYKKIDEQEFTEINLLIDQTIQSRTKTMVSCLQKIDNLISQLNLHQPKVVFLSGIAHLETEEDKATDERHSLISLYEELSKHKAIVLLPTWVLSTDRIERIGKIEDPIHGLA